jgi:hypothetical protein
LAIEELKINMKRYFLTEWGDAKGENWTIAHGL